jgi:hypothetical protein
VIRGNNVIRSPEQQYNPLHLLLRDDPRQVEIRLPEGYALGHDGELRVEENPNLPDLDHGQVLRSGDIIGLRQSQRVRRQASYVASRRQRSFSPNDFENVINQ